MSGPDIAVAVLLGICAVTALICCLAVVVLPDYFERLHFMSTVTTISSGALLVAVVVKEGWGQATIKTILTFLVLLLINAVLTHATARARRVRERGHWEPDPEEHIEGAGRRRA